MRNTLFHYSEQRPRLGPPAASVAVFATQRTKYGSGWRAATME